MDYEKAYKEALERAKEVHKINFSDSPHCEITEFIFPELKESEDEKIRKALIDGFTVMKESKNCGKTFSNHNIPVADILDWLEKQKNLTDEEYEQGKKDVLWCINKAAQSAKDENEMGTCWFAEKWLEKQKEPSDKGEISDGYHTFNELYYYRMLYNAAFFNLLPKEWVHKSKKHHDGEKCFGGGWFIVMANLPTGQISNHYELKDWDLFQIQEKEIADEWDGHTPQQAAERLHKYLLEKPYKPKEWSEEDSQTLQRIIDFIWYNRKGDTDTIYQQEKDIKWLKSLKDRVLPRPKQEWDEEDEKIKNTTISFLDEFKSKGYENAVMCIDWLKSIKK